MAETFVCRNCGKVAPLAEEELCLECDAGLCPACFKSDGGLCRECVEDGLERDS